LLSETFSLSIFGFAVMSNHVHLIVETHPEHSQAWTDVEVAKRWVRVFPAETETRCRRKEMAILADTHCLALYRERLGSLSWLMRCLVEPIACHANETDGCTGRFWQGRFKKPSIA
jgi:hypothetical protein